MDYVEAANKCLNTVYRLALVCVKDKLDAENVAKKVFCKYSSNYHKNENEEQVRMWFIRTVIWCCISIKYSDWYRARCIRDEATDVMMYVYENDVDNELLEYLKMRPFFERVAVHLAHHENMTAKQISSTFLVRKVFVERWLSRAAEVQAGRWANVPEEQFLTYNERYNQFMEQFIVRDIVEIEISHILVDVKVVNENTPPRGGRIRLIYIVCFVAAIMIALINAGLLQNLMRENPNDFARFAPVTSNDNGSAMYSHLT